MSEIARMRAIIENECFMQDVEPDFVSKGCEFAIYEYQQNSDFAQSVGSGIAVAIKCQHNANNSSELAINSQLINASKKQYKSA
ncbi:MAG: hypothetical protein KUG78_15630 [Kangiellaceae bacterium]|nr:hypothetical protein [Kangiellaceae bacterium]